MALKTWLFWTYRATGQVSEEISTSPYYAGKVMLSINTKRGASHLSLHLFSTVFTSYLIFATFSPSASLWPPCTLRPTRIGHHCPWILGPPWFRSACKRSNTAHSAPHTVRSSCYITPNINWTLLCWEHENKNDKQILSALTGREDLESLSDGFQYNIKEWLW